MRQSQWLGLQGEKLAQKHLLSKGYTILRTHYTCHWGELDIIARRNQTIVFVEVKTRVSARKGEPYEAVNFYKLKHLSRPILFYLLQNKLTKYKLSLDVISIYLDHWGDLQKLTHFQNIDVPSNFF